MRKLIRADGSEEVWQRKLSMREVNSLIGADTADSFMLADRVHVCIVDDDGWDTECVDHGDGHIELVPITPRKPINAKATALYHDICHPGTTHQIAGDVFICPDEDFA